MTRISISLLVVLAVAAHAGAALVDDFDGGGWTDNYTLLANAGAGAIIISQETAATSTVLLTPKSGSNVGSPSPWAPPSSVRAMGHVWNGPETVSMGDSASVWTSVNSSSADGGGLLLKTISGGGAYVVGLADKFSGTSLELQIMAHGLTSTGGGGMAFTNAGQLANHTSQLKTTVGNFAGSWVHIDASIAISGSDNVITATLRDTSGSLIGTFTYTDSGSAAVSSRSTGSAGLFNWGWNGTADFDDLAIVPEPASMTVLAVGGLLMLIRRRRNR